MGSRAEFVGAHLSLNSDALLRSLIETPMSPRIAQILLWMSLVSIVPASAHDAPAAAGGSPQALDAGLSRLHHPVSTRNRQAQAYFDQGMRLVFAFNHDAAIKSFQRAAELDPDLAMAHWGIALALGPNINLPMDPAAHKAAYAELQKAIVLKPKASPVEREYIDALSTRYSANAEADLAPLQVAYKDAMKQLARRHPRDTDTSVLYAESLMDLHPWKLWAPNGTPAEGTLELVRVLEYAQTQQPDHIGALHYYLHAIEASPHPEKAVAAAKRLESLAPSAGHLVHMPAHIYIRTGNYIDAVRVNEAAVRADERLATSGAKSFYLVAYYGHNLHFLAICNAIAGNFAQAMAAANKLYAHASPMIKEIPPLDGFLYTPALVLAKFERWDDILALPEPAFEAPISGTVWRLARTLALAGKGRLVDAAAERAKFIEATNSLPKTLELGNNNAGALVAIARPYLDGRIALMRGNFAEAIRYLREAVAAEDALAYDEPTPWYLPSREALGAALLRAGDFTAAEKTFRDDLVRNPESGRSLFGLHAALAAEGRGDEAAKVKARFERAWRAADVKLDAASLL
jgi:tetratricopeptide (TPR) repeat protein